MINWATLTKWCLLVAMASGVGPQQSAPDPPEYYAALDAWIGGEIVRIDESRGQLTIAPLDELRERSPRSRNLVDRERPVALVELRYAKGWAYFDDEGNQQIRLTLKEGRSRLRVGQFVEIGRAKGFHGGYDRSSVQVNGSMGTVVNATKWTFRGWIPMRVSPFRETERPAT